MEHQTENNEIRIREEEHRRADNQIWNAAGQYDFRPQFRSYDADGRARLYWNSVAGAVHKHYGDDLEEMWETIHKAIAEDICTQLAWLSLESACYDREKELRPAFPILRQQYAEQILQETEISLPYPYDAVYRCHFQKAAGKKPEEYPEEDEKVRRLLERVELSGSLNGQELSRAILAYLDERTLLLPRIPEAELSKKHRIHIPFLKKKTEQSELPHVRRFGDGIGEYGDATDLGTVYTGKHIIWDMDEMKSDASVKQFVRDILGTPLFTNTDIDRMERTICTDDHEGCHLYFARGDGKLGSGIQGRAGNLRRNHLQQMKHNYDYYLKHREEAGRTIQRLTEQWTNAFLTYRQDSLVRSNYGNIRSDRIWRSEKVHDDKIFERVIAADHSDYYVDILIDGSLSQEERQRRVALQAYMIAESLTKCRIPVRVSSFCSFSGYTALIQYRDYWETTENEQIFHFITTGGNRDGLALRALGHLMELTPVRPEHRIVIVLSDAKPNDASYITRGRESGPYREAVAVDNTSMEVRRLKNQGCSVLCVYTGLDEDLPAAHAIYNRDFVRIRSLDQFAQAVGGLILTQIRE